MLQIKLSENFRAVFYAPFYATLELGFLPREGVEVELIGSSTPGSAVTGLLDGSIDVTWGGPMRVMKARDEQHGPPLVCFCEVVGRDPFYLIGRRRDAVFALQDLVQLKFASVSEVPTPWLCLQHDLREQGIDPDRVCRIGDRTMAENLEALRKHELDVVQVFEPYASMAVRQGIGDILHAAAERGSTSYTTLLATRDGVERKKAALSALVRAIGHTRAWIRGHSGDELASVVAPYFPSVNREDLASALGRYEKADLWTCDPSVSRQGFRRLAESLRSGGFISRMPSYDDCVVDHFSI